MKYTKLERNWVMYDVGNSALVLLQTSVVPIYFNALAAGASSAGLVTAWANAQTVASLVVAFLMPILGALARLRWQQDQVLHRLLSYGPGAMLCAGRAHECHGVPCDLRGVYDWP